MNLAYILPVALLGLSNVFMTFAWYWHLKYHDVALWKVIAISWGIALLEYCLAVPANRFGAAVYSPAQLKTIQEVITLTVFVGFAALYLGEKITFGQIAGFVLIAVGAGLVFFMRPSTP